ncbi:eb532daf-0e22-4794-a0d5-e2ca1bd9cbb7 [Sclerotinia trifoliorum]|uniref:Eb532daf-0e22-4794-a0d5-e2ca1bd9cbb7 n=1 Tax=Sclerotinia trifoliorum TaxID=28548 RepID=A0A8H2VL42_9HELO|nr:eb532daf-0e22-4794-a0d5-e2ca1bd9cbb7 [Sclerotinia trifoliorum]
MSSEKHTTDDHSVIIIGAGWQGIAAARTYLQLKPNVKLTVIDSDSSIGGVWSIDRSYPGLIADSPVGCYEFSDMCMDEDPELKMWNTIPGHKVGEYLRKFSKRFHIDEHLRLNTRVLSAISERGINGVSRWILEVQTKGKEKETLNCDKLIVASGPSSDPRMPDLDTSQFNGPFFHSLYLGSRHAELTADNIKHVSVVGGNKSAAEVVNLCASAGKKVTWLIREGGAGPGMLIQVRSGKVHTAAIAFSRWAGLTVPCLLRTHGFWYWLLHSGFFWPGIWLIGKYWEWASHYMFKGLYDQSENAKKIAPDCKHLFWSTSAPSFLQEDSTLFEKLNAGILIDVQRTHITKIHSNSVSLDNGTHLATDALVFATGWNLTYSKFFSPEARLELDLPIPFGEEPPSLKAYWKALDTEADQWVHKTFPFLSNPPKTNENPPENTPYHLYRQSIPPTLATRNDRSIAFLGVLASPQIPTYAELSALWSIAYLENMHSFEVDKVFSDKLTMDLATARTNAFMKWRYRRAGIIEPNVGAEVQDLCDLLCAELGVEGKRKEMVGGWKASWNEWFSPYRSVDYKGIVGEFLEVVRKREEAKAKTE